MANISYDRQSLMVDGRRIWPVSGTIDYARVPQELWPQRIAAARQAGLNCILTSVFWNVHEPQPEVFRFENNSDLRRFVQLVAEAGMWCILRPGPFVGGGWDMGGLPPWLLESGQIKLRQADPAFLQAVARYLDAVLAQVRDLQMTQPRGGPIILVQTEHEWFCHHEEQAEAYLQQINRFLRESGCQVPLINCNNLWQQVPGTIDGWNGADQLFSNCRQLRVVQNDAPCIVTSLPTCEPQTWGRNVPRDRAAARLLHDMAQVTAAGGMFNLDPFCGGVNFAFHGGRLADGDDRFLTTAHGADAPVGPAGQRGEKYALTRRLCTFINHFQNLMGALNPIDHHTVASPGQTLTTIQQTGTQGNVVFVFQDEEDLYETVNLTTPDGQSLNVEMGDEPLAWIVLDANLDGVGMLDLSNLRPWAFVDRRMLVMYGPAGSDGLISIDGTLHHVTVPSGAQPLTFRHDPLTIVVANDQQIDAAYLHAEGLYVGVGGLDAESRPLPHRRFATYVNVDFDGKTKRFRREPTPRAAAPRLGRWSHAAFTAYTEGKAPRFATLNGPQSLEACSADFGYGWYRLRLSRKRAKKVNLLLPQAGDRLHMYLDGKFRCILGVGPGAFDKVHSISLPAGDADLVFLADNLGRYSQGACVDQPKGLFGHMLDVQPLTLRKPSVSREPRIDPFELNGYVPRCSSDDHGPYARYTFEVKLSRKQQLVLSLRGERPRSVILVNNKPVALDIEGTVTAHMLLEDHLRKGVNKITLALIDRAPSTKYDPRKNAALFKVVENLSADAGIWYAKWQMPAASAFKPLPSPVPQGPAFFRTTFSVEGEQRPLWLEVIGATKGQIYLNGHNVGRYFVATHTGKKVPPQKRYYLPEPWLHTQAENELVLFDEHGKAPTRCRLST